MPDVDPFERFPELTPIRRAPSAFTFNGVGTTLYGERDRDRESQTYVKTQFFTIVYLPILALGAYRVADADQGWHFLGRVPLSPAVKLWNVCLLILVALAVAFSATQTMRADDPMGVARKTADAGQFETAVTQYNELALGGGSHAVDAAEAAVALITAERLQALPQAARLALLSQLVEAHDRLGQRSPYGRIWEVATTLDLPARQALALLDAAAPLASDSELARARRFALVRKWAEAEPDSPDAISELAVAHEARSDPRRALALLMPLEQQLGDREGARILGRALARAGKLDRAFALLSAYIDARLPAYHAAEKHYAETYQRVNDEINRRLIDELDAYLRALPTDAERQEHFRKQHAQAMREHPELQRLRGSIRVHARAVNVALELGMLRLRRARGMPSPEQRKTELEGAERTFLAIRGAANNSRQYQLCLGQVHYWLGKPVKGKAAFDRLLKQDRSPVVLLQVGVTLREVGQVGEARALFEEAYGAAKQPRTKFDAAGLLAVIATRPVDKVRWLERCDPARFETRAELAFNRGLLARDVGDVDKAVALYREAIKIYDSQPVSAVTLNNGAMAHGALFETTGEIAAFDASLERMEKSLALSPGSAILLGNVAGQLIRRALIDLAGDRIDYALLGGGIGAAELRFLYIDAASRAKLASTLLANPRCKRAMSLIDKALVLAPKQLSLYREQHQLLSWSRDVAPLRALLQRMRAAKPDHSALERYLRESVSGKYEPRQRKIALKAATDLKARRARLSGTPDLTSAILARRLVSNALTRAQYGLRVDPAPLLVLAKQAHEATPSSGTRAGLTQALLLSIGCDLLARPDYEALHAQCRRAFDHADLIAALNAAPGQRALREAIHAHPLFARVLALEIEGERRFPDHPSVGSWALLCHHAEWGPKLAAALKQSELFRVEQALGRATLPSSPAGLIGRVRAAQATGVGLKEALAEYDAAKSRMPLPPVR